MKRFFLSLGLAILVFALAAAGAFAWWANHPLPLSKSPVEVVIKPNSGVASVGRQIQRGGVGMDPRLFMLLVRLTGHGPDLKAGGYEFATGATPLSIIGKLARGEVTHYVVTVIEGWEFRKMRAAVDASPALRHDTRDMSDAELMKAIGAAETSPEGMFFPDTYLFARGSSDIDLYKHAYRAMQRRLNEAWNARSPDLPYKTPYEALVMASIVEKETGQAAERPMIAAVFINRLRKNMMLQTDPTVIYGLGDGFDGDLRKRDLQADNPYNTYTRTGLPPTPIALPGLASLAAATTPAPSDALYFVARGDGSSHFSNSLPEHNRAVDKYQRGK
ncbi:Endolytic transglycosylase MltG, terminates peptidoglycan polymerization [Cupriavidus necator]|uniref:Endolytic murein transglycosylase n=1 Tax=Cupriavidus necator (strain ATCC 17699 / DSM 428 / KCTC 22496 / NCIMB 10442 / H16 / Stanier 337) TaxID=381666 RepID=Q0KBC1_CUPNH|nr:endolytic transglycosylase MltG [Cupriavidus necator]QCC00574.1 endolytic transglycosylase MltG [Cupriavidus necator H16]QQB76605.1 endolytic transglycosylase MltG [Cupriavidus necator]WKA42438.1 endolytic transglycosylase MltG [Cupriavidus necator]CAJ92700.1 aminodeoxychorismate lyase [Cupriavidus necator H16]